MESTWKALMPDLGIWESWYKFSAGTSRSLLCKLSDGAYLVYSPGTIDTAQAALELTSGADAKVYLLEPNSFHNLGLAPWLQVFENATIVGTEPCRRRFQAKFGLTVEPLDVLRPFLPTHLALLDLPSSKVGEVWLSIKDGDASCWAVGDAFFNFASLPERGFMKWFMRFNRMGPGLEISRIYTWLGFSDKNEFRAWLKDKLSLHQPNALIPCHGSVLKDHELPNRIQRLVEARL